MGRQSCSTDKKDERTKRGGNRDTPRGRDYVEMNGRYRNRERQGEQTQRQKVKVIMAGVLEMCSLKDGLLNSPRIDVVHCLFRETMTHKHFLLSSRRLHSAAGR